MKTTDIDGNVQVEELIRINKAIGELSGAVDLLFNDNPDDEKGVERVASRLQLALKYIQESHETISSYLK
ncbi:hypothetical protein LCGC14_2938630 [marine sediment metagenome]|uniref:Uncharacterized protein n=1 Tax=marine sediment metagenome TaxID=412755 RepID=A0A0F8XIQ8_9ZZZZ